ncbi:MAG: alpha/beta fold hydrolase [Alphaproteobacteria bacterium]|nr:alpha/beta fold hydrolase [Alphaproteobacteria bacterium]
MKRITALGAMLAAGIAMSAQGQGYPAPREGTWTAKDFRFHTGEVIPELRLAYTTIGDPGGEPVLILHGTGGSAGSMLTPGFAGELFGPGQPLDATRYFIVIPDALGAGKSAKPSDGLRARFPAYNYDDMVHAQHRLLTEALGIRHLRLVLGNSMGGMHAWLWGTTHPDMMDALVPMACQPTEMSARNWMMRRLMIESIRRDPAYMGGDYASQPPSLRIANVFYATGTNGGTLAYQALVPTRALADRMVADRLAAPPPLDANDFLYQWESSKDYNPEPLLGQVRARVLLVNSADDERNPPETGITERALAKVPGARLLLIPASAETRGHGTTGMAKFWKKDLEEVLATAPRRR